VKTKKNQLSQSFVGLSRLLVTSSFLGILAFAPAAWAVTETFTTPSTFEWEVPAGVSLLTVEARGAGGAGGSAENPANTGGNVRGGGGAGGNYARTESIPVVPGTKYVITVGGGGVAPAVTGFTSGQSVSSQIGGASAFKTLDLATTLVQAAGGPGGQNMVRPNVNGAGGVQPTLDSNTIGTVRWKGGNGGGAWGGALGGGNGGGGAGTVANGGNGVANNTTDPTYGRGIGGNVGGGNGAIGAALNSTSNAGDAPGGGGGGAARNVASTTSSLVSQGGAGGSGSVTLTYDVVFNTGLAKFAVTSPTSPLITGDVFEVTITALDLSDQVATGENGINTVTMTSPSAGSFIEFDWNGDGTYGDNSGTLVNGVKIIKARNRNAQTATIVASAGTFTTPSPLSMETLVGPFTKLQILAPGEIAAPGTTTGKTGAPTNRASGVQFNATVNAVDAFWNIVVSIADEVAITSTDGAALLPVNGPLVDGTFAFPVTLNTPGNQTLTASDVTDNTKAVSTTPNLFVNPVSRIWNGANNNLWDLVWDNWSGSTFQNNNAVTFNDVGTSQPNVDIFETVLPFSITVTGTVPYTLGSTSGGKIGGTTGITKSGTGILTISTANEYSGSTIISGGALVLGNATAVPATSVLTLSGGTLGLGVGDFTRSLGTGPGQIQITATNSGFAAFGADRAVNLGGASAQVSFGAPGFFSGVTGNPTFILGNANSAHTLDFQNPINLVSGIKFFNVPDGGATVDARLSGAITGPTTFSKAGAGTLELTNTGNAWTDVTFIDAGTLRLGAANVLPGTTVEIKRANALESSPLLDLNGFSETIGAIILGSNNTSGNADQEVSIVDSAAGTTAVLTVGGTISYRAGNNPPALNGQATISANVNTGVTTRTISVGDGSGAVDLLISGELTGGAIDKTGLGVLSVSKPKYSGNTTVSAGVLRLGAVNSNNEAANITIAATGATLNLDYVGNSTVGGLVITGSPVLTSGTYGGTEGPGVTVIPQITGTGTITIVSDPYLTWAGAGVTFAGDANNDGVANGLAWLLGATSPNVSALNKLPVVVQLPGGGLQLTFSMLPSAARGGATLSLQHSSDLGLLDPWASVLVPEATGGTAPVTFVVSGTSPLGVVGTVDSSEAAGGKLFGRLRANR
jgi:autotransporter-associated beta strand protein